jgi:hypothetical protein
VESVDGLFAADEYITFFENGVSNVDWLELHNGSFLNANTNAPNFAYFGIQSVHLLAEAGDELVSTTTGESDVRIHAAVQADGSVAVMILNMNTSSRSVDVSIAGGTVSEDGVLYQTNGDTALSMTSVSGLGNSFSTTIPARNLQRDCRRRRLLGLARQLRWRDANQPRSGQLRADRRGRLRLLEGSLR